MFLLNNSKIYAHEYSINFQVPHSPLAEGVVSLHQDILVYLVMIMIFVTYILGRTIYLFQWENTVHPRGIAHKEQVFLEVIWTVLPILILVLIGIPSLSLLYSLEETVEPSLTVHAIGRQWYWSYEYNDYRIEYDSCMITEEDLNPGELRLLEVDNRLITPTNMHVRLMISSSDVIHSWTIPSLGIKVDAIPGRVNQCHIYTKKVGIYYGQCSEICGVGHGYMPIVLQSIKYSQFIDYIYNRI